MPEITLPGSSKLYYETYNLDNKSADVSPILFLNGMTQTTMSWKTLARRLRDTYPVITYDAQGQGQSIPAKDASFELAMHADDLSSLLDELDVERVHLVGFSHGSRVALAMANHHPQRVDHLVLCSATATPTALQRTIIRGWREILRHGGLEAMSWAALPTILGNAYLEQHEHLIKGIISASTSRNQPEGVASLLDAMMHYPDLSELATQVQSPTLVISGEEDLLVTRTGAEKLAELCGGTHHEVAQVAHTVPIENPGEFQKLLLDFLP